MDFEEEIKEQVKEAFINIYQISMKEARKHRRSLTTDDLKLIRTFVSKYRIGMLSKTDLIATYIGRGIFKTEGHLKGWDKKNKYTKDILFYICTFLYFFSCSYVPDPTKQEQGDRPEGL